MTKEQLEAMFLAEEAWDRVKADVDLIGKLIEAIAQLNENIVRLTEALSD